MGLTHGLLYLMRVGIYDYGTAYSHGKEVPSPFEDMSNREEGDDTIFISYWDALVVVLERCSILAAGEYHALRFARST